MKAIPAARDSRSVSCVTLKIFIIPDTVFALAAKLGGDLTAFHGGQVTLDPIPYIRREPFGMVLFPILSSVVGGWMMGWAGAPYDPYTQRHPHRAA